MIKINDIEIENTDTEWGLMWADGEESWEFEDEEHARVTAKLLETLRSGATVIKRHVFLSKAEVAE